PSSFPWSGADRSSRERDVFSAALTANEARAMLAQAFALDYTSPTPWLVPGVGVTVGAFAFVLLGFIRRWLRRRRGGSREEDLSWEDLLESLRRRRREREEAGLAADEDLPPEELFTELLGTLPSAAVPEPAAALEDLQFETPGGVERRAGRRRWGNPTEVH